MSLNYQSGRISRGAFGIPGFSTSGDLTLDVSGSLGIGTTQPRAEADVPNISIRGTLRDSSNDTGANAYYLSQDTVGVRWRAGNPDAVQVINVQDDGVQVGLGSFDTLNFRGSDPFVVTINEGNPNTLVADILINPGFVKTQYGSAFGLVTSFGPDGTFWSIPGYEPGYGITGSVGFTSVGLGTNLPADDFQVGVGSTGVTINAALGRVRAQIVEADSIEVDGNLTVESLVVTPGIATLTDLQVVNSAFIPLAQIGILTANNANVTIGTFQSLVGGAVTLGVGSAPTNIEGDFFVNAGLGSFRNDLFVGGDLEVGGEFTVGQLNAINAIISGIATINEIEGNVGVFTGIQVGLLTAGQLGFNTAIGVDLDVDDLFAGVGSITELQSGIATIGFASITDANITGVATVNQIDVEDIDIQNAQVGILTITEALSVTGTSTFVGLVTVTGEVFIDGDLTVTQQFTVKDLGAENLEVSGIGTIVELRANTGIITSLNTENLNNSGIITSGRLESDTLNTGIATIASIFATEIDADEGRIGILTGDLVSYGIGTFGTAIVGFATVGIITGDQLFYYGDSEINGVSFLEDLFQVNRDVEINSGITTINTGPTGVGFATFSNDVYIGNDLYVAGELSFEQLTGTNLLVTGIGTVNDLRFNVGTGTYLNLDFLEVGVGTINRFDSTLADIVDIQNETLTVENRADIRVLDARFVNIRPDAENPGSGLLDSTFAQIGVATIQLLDAVVAGIESGSIDEAQIGIASVGIASVGLASISNLQFGDGEGGNLSVGFVTAGGGQFDTIAIGNTSIEGEGTVIDDNGIITDNGVFRGILTATTGIITDLSAETASIDAAGISSANIQNEIVGVSTVGFSNITDLNAGVGTVGILTVTESLFSTGVSTFVGVTSIFGSAVVDGDLTVTGVTTFNQLDAEQSKIGILTVTDILDASTADVTANNLGIRSDLTVSGFSSFTGFATFTDAEFDQITVGILSVTEQAYFENIYQSPTGIATLNVVGINSALIDQTTIGVATVGFGSFTNLFAANADITGVITATGEITIEGEVSITGIATIDQLDVTGIATIANEIVGFSSIGIATISEADVDDLDVEFIRVGTYATIGRPGAANTTAGIMSVTGVSTFVGLVTTKGDLYVDGDLYVTGIQSIPQLNADQAQIGILTITGYTDNQGNLGVVGFTTLNQFSFNSGVGSTVTVGFASITNGNVTGVLTVAQDLLVERNLKVNGITTLGSASTVTGFTTVISDLYVGGDLYVRDDILKDEIKGRNMLITGVGTVNTLYSNVGFITTLSGDLVTYETADFEQATIDYADIDRIQAGVTTTQNLIVSNESSLGFATAVRLTVSTNATISGITSTSNLVVTDLANIENLTVKNETILEGEVSIENKVSILDDVLIGNSPGAGISLTVNDNIYTDKLELRHVEAETINVGVTTVTERLDINDTTSVYSVRATTNNTTGTVVETIDSSVYSTFEFTVSSVREGGDFQSSKVHGVADGTNVFFNEYSTVFNNGEIIVLDVLPGGSQYSIFITNVNAVGIVTNTLNFTLTRVP